MSAREWIERKKRGGALDDEQIAAFVRGVSSGELPDYQISALLMAIWFRGMNAAETARMTLEMRDSGRTLRWEDLNGPSADKHSTGGVGDKVSLVLAPLAAEMGMFVPMLSGRGLGHTGGTLDKLEAIEGYRIDLPVAEFQRQVREIGCAIIGQTAEIAPADRRLYQLRDVTGTVDCIPLIVSSILSKKFAAGPENLVIDLKMGSGAFMRDLESARALGMALMDVADLAGRKMSVLITDMNQPLGVAIGHALECAEAMQCLAGGGPKDLRDLSLELCAQMAALCGLGDLGQCRARAKRALDTGAALERFHRMGAAQGARLREGKAQLVEIAPEAAVLRADRDGVLGSMDVAEVGLSLLPLKGARERTDSRLDLGTGVRMEARLGDRLRMGDPIARIHARSEADASACSARLRSTLRIVDQADAPPLIHELLESAG